MYPSYNSQAPNVFQKVGVLGAGAWGTALALTALRAGRNVLMWAREEEVVTSIQNKRENTPFLPNITIPEDLNITRNITDLFSCDIVLSVLPAQYTSEVLKPFAKTWPADLPIIIASKGIEIATGRVMSEVIEHTLPDRPYAILSGPTFASETARNKPTAVTIATQSEHFAGRLIQTLGHQTFRPYASLDPIGTQLGGALKNVIAIACGFIAGLNFGENARAALMTRGLVEITRFSLLKGAKRETLMGLSGMGDLMLTCSSLTSRNMSLGKALGAGRSLEEIMAERSSVAEGVPTAAAIATASAKLDVDMPICTAVNSILTGQKGLQQAMSDLLSRPFKFENDPS